MVLANFQFDNKLGRSRFFQKTFLVANTSVKVVLVMAFLTFNNENVVFKERGLTWRSYTPTEALPTSKRLQMINWKEFAIAALDQDKEVFVMHMAYLGS